MSALPSVKVRLIVRFPSGASRLLVVESDSLDSAVSALRERLRRKAVAYLAIESRVVS